MTAARALDLTLTARNKGSDDEIPMAGVPHHAASAYVQRLLEQGFKVAICEQMADPSKVKGLVPREVVRVVTPGIAYDDAGIDARKNHYLVAVERARDVRGRGARSVDRRAARVRGARHPNDAGRAGAARSARGADGTRGGGCGTGPRVDAHEGRGPRRLPRSTRPPPMPRSTSSSGGGEARASCPSAVARRAAARCVDGGAGGEAGRPLPIARLAFYELGDTLVLDEATQAHLELVRSVDGGERGSLLGQIDATRTAPGARLLRRRLLAPLTNVADIRRRHDGVGLVRGTARSCGGELRRAARPRWATSSASPSSSPSTGPPRATSSRSVARSRPCPSWSRRSRAAPSPTRARPSGLGRARAVDRRVRRPLRSSSDAPSRTIPPRAPADGGVVRDGFDAALDEARELMRGGQRLIVELEARLRDGVEHPQPEAALHARLRLVHRGDAERTSPRRPAAWRRKQTVASGERFTCEELDALADKLAHAEERAAAREAELFSSLVRQLAGHAERLRADLRPPGRLGRRGGAGRGGPSRRLGQAGGRRLARAGTAGRAAPRRREARRRRSLRSQRRLARSGRDPAPPLARHRSEHGGQVDAHAPDCARGDPRADGKLRPRTLGPRSASSIEC